MRIEAGTQMSARGRALFACGFRVFFLLAALHGALFAPLWVMVASGMLPAPPWLSPPLWHAHEMIYGWAAAAAAGFLLTAVPVWTAREPLRGLPLAALAGLWLLGRLAMSCAAWLPRPLVAAADLAFMAALLVALAPAFARADQRRNWVFLVVLGLWIAINTAFHAAAAGLLPAASPSLAAAALDTVLLLVLLVGGRIIPAFTRNALALRGNPQPIRSYPLLDRFSITASAAVLLLDAFAPAGGAAASAKGAAALSIGLRMLGWRSLSTRSDPLLWSLHTSFACLPGGLALLCLAELGAPFPRAAGLHLLAIGGFGGMILSVMSRVALGHTGRPLQAPSPMSGAYLAVLASAGLRVAAVLAPDLAPPLLWASAASFSAAFLAFLIVYAPILVRPRADGRPG